MISSFATKTTQVLILITLGSRCITAERVLGSMFEIQISDQLPLEAWTKKALGNPDPYAQWDTTCYEFNKATRTMENDITKRLVGCRSTTDNSGKTQLKIYLAILPNQLRMSKQLPCLLATYQKAFAEWKASVSKRFGVKPEAVQFSSKFENVHLEVQQIQSSATEAEIMLQNEDERWDTKRKHSLKKFLLGWMKSINGQYPLISMTAKLEHEFGLKCILDMCFEVTDKEELITNERFSDHMLEMAKSSEDTFKLASISEGFPEVIDSEEFLLQQCEEEVAQTEIGVETMHGSALEIELKVQEDEWVRKTETDVNPFAGWSPICDQFIKATSEMDAVIKANLIGCRSNRMDNKIRLKIYLALVIEDLTSETVTACKTKLFAKWAKAVTGHFNLQSSEVIFKSEYSTAKLQVMSMLGNVDKDGEKIFPTEILNDQDKKYLKKFLVHWIHSIDRNSQLVFLDIIWDDNLNEAVKINLLFDVTDRPELDMLETVSNLTDSARAYNGSTKLFDCKLLSPELPDTSGEKLTSCDDDDVNPEIVPESEENPKTDYGSSDPEEELQKSDGVNSGVTTKTVTEEILSQSDKEMSAGISGIDGGNSEIAAETDAVNSEIVPESVTEEILSQSDKEMSAGISGIDTDNSRDKFDSDGGNSEIAAETDAVNSEIVPESVTEEILSQSDTDNSRDKFDSGIRSGRIPNKSNAVNSELVSESDPEEELQKSDELNSGVTTKTDGMNSGVTTKTGKENGFKRSKCSAVAMGLMYSLLLILGRE